MEKNSEYYRNGHLFYRKAKPNLFKRIKLFIINIFSKEKDTLHFNDITVYNKYFR